MTGTTISEIPDVSALAVSGFTDWKRYGDVITQTDGDLTVFNYSHAALYAGRWNFFERVSRGLIVDTKTGEIVARAFDKFFNWGEPQEKPSGSIVSVTRKLDGVLGVLYRVNGGYRIATRGSFHSPQAEWATEFLNKHHPLPGLSDEWTLLFEIVYPGSRIVIDYSGVEELVLLAARNRRTGAYLPFRPDVVELGERYGFPTPEVYSFAEVSAILPQLEDLPADHEGFVVEFSDGQRVKFKGRKYLELHRAIMHLSFDTMLDAVKNGTVESVKAALPEEYWPQCDAWLREITDTVGDVARKIGILWGQAPRETRKEFAMWVLADHKDMAPYLFALLDLKPLTPLILRNAFKDRPRETPKIAEDS